MKPPQFQMPLSRRPIPLQFPKQHPQSFTPLPKLEHRPQALRCQGVALGARRRSLHNPLRPCFMKPAPSSQRQPTPSSQQHRPPSLRRTRMPRDPPSARDLPSKSPSRPSLALHPMKQNLRCRHRRHLQQLQPANQPSSTERADHSSRRLSPNRWPSAQPSLSCLSNRPGSHQHRHQRHQHPRQQQQSQSLVPCQRCGLCPGETLGQKSRSRSQGRVRCPEAHTQSAAFASQWPQACQWGRSASSTRSPRRPSHGSRPSPPRWSTFPRLPLACFPGAGRQTAPPGTRGCAGGRSAATGGRLGGPALRDSGSLAGWAP